MKNSLLYCIIGVFLFYREKMFLYILLKSLLMLTVLPRQSAAQGAPSECPAHCICHETWNEILRTKLNAVDCTGRQALQLLSSMKRQCSDSEALWLVRYHGNSAVDAVSCSIFSVDLEGNNSHCNTWKLKSRF